MAASFATLRTQADWPPELSVRPSMSTVASADAAPGSATGRRLWPVRSAGVPARGRAESAPSKAKSRSGCRRANRSFAQLPENGLDPGDVLLVERFFLRQAGEERRQFA